MTLRRQKYKKRFGIFSQSNTEPRTIETPLTFRQAWARLMKSLKHSILPSEYLGLKCYIKNRGYKIVGETVDNFFLSEFPSKAFPKVGNKYKISK